MKTINMDNLREMFVGGATLLEINKDYVDSLNVFPVPDGDTGTNMSMTMSSAVREINDLKTDEVDVFVNTFARGALKGARGNSGVILSQILKGLCNVIGDSKEITTKVFAKAFAEATDVAYSAVTKPKEGTILTVIRYIAEQSKAIAMRNSDFIAFLECIIAKGEEILAKTPDMLPVLKAAGVVDAGGKGLLFVIQGFYNVLAGVPMESACLDCDNTFDALDNFVGDIHDLANIKYAYCTEYFIINLKNSTTEEDIVILRDRLMAIGDCVIAIGDLSMVKVHVHTNEPNKALKYSLKLGELDRIKIDNMLEENRELIKRKEASKKKNAMISICTGKGLSAIFKDLQVDTVIEGGQTMNPSVEDILNVIERVNSENVIVIPNNKNIILAAEQACELSKKNVRVVKTENVPEGIAAAIAFDVTAELDDIVENMVSASSEVGYGEITYAVRKTVMDGFELEEGDIIGITGKQIVAKSSDVNEVVYTVLDSLINEDTAVATLYYGDGVTEDEAKVLKKNLENKYEDLDIEMYFGGQHHYYYLLSTE